MFFNTRHRALETTWGLSFHFRQSWFRKVCFPDPGFTLKQFIKRQLRTRKTFKIFTHHPAVQRRAQDTGVFIPPGPQVFAWSSGCPFGHLGQVGEEELGGNLHCLKSLGDKSFISRASCQGELSSEQQQPQSCLINSQAGSSFASRAGSMQWGKAVVSDRLLSDRQTSSSDISSGSGKLHPYQQMCLYCKYHIYILLLGPKNTRVTLVFFFFFRIFVRILMTIQCSLSGFTRSTSVLSYYWAFGWLPSFLICKQGCCKQAAFSGCGFIPS